MINLGFFLRFFCESCPWVALWVWFISDRFRRQAFKLAVGGVGRQAPAAESAARK